MALSFDRLATATPLEVVRFDGMTIGADAEGAREPHRHDYHELLWVRSGEGEHLVDGEPVAVVPGAVTVIGRGQVHQFAHARDIVGAVVRFGEELRPGSPWLLATCSRAMVVPVPAGEAARLEAVVGALEAEAARPPDPHTSDLERHLLSVLLLWIERWGDGARGERPPAEGAGLHRRFLERLEADYARHHDAAHYADALAVPAAALSRTLVAATGRTTKELVTDRVMLEAARLLRFSDLSVSEVAHRVGYSDPLYFSRAFKRHAGEAPQAFRARALGR